MKSSSLFQLGGAAILIAAILYAIANLAYFLGGQPDAPTALGLWLSFSGDTLLLLGLGALYARQSHRAGILGLVGYVLMFVATMFFIGNYAVSLGVAAGAISNEQIAQVPAYSLSNMVTPWLWFAGLIVFGISIYRAQVFPKYAGVLLILLALVQQLTGPLAFTRPIFAILSSVAFGWLGWALLTHRSVATREPVPAM